LKGGDRMTLKEEFEKLLCDYKGQLDNSNENSHKITRKFSRKVSRFIIQNIENLNVHDLEQLNDYPELRRKISGKALMVFKVTQIIHLSGGEM
jgi:hypothetical protein